MFILNLPKTLENSLILSYIKNKSKNYFNINLVFFFTNIFKNVYLKVKFLLKLLFTVK